ncbi:DNA primase [Desulfovibrio sp. OttesenSCG-928-C06]|nr:DNA primase [Desulfovibrio sp. OttesenSCG-928-C06]
MSGQKGYAGASATQAIKDRLNIVDIIRRYVNLQRAGNRWMGPCPFHQETKGSFSVNEEQGFFYCFGCQASGDIFDFYARINGLEFKDALEQLAEEAGVQLKAQPRDPRAERVQDLRKAAVKMHEAAKSFYSRNLASSSGQACREYIQKRELDQSIVEAFELGWSLPEWNGLSQALERSGFNREQAVESGLLIRGERGSIYDRFRSRLMFPIKNLSGQVIAFGGRIIDNADTAKYINSSDSPIYKKGDNLYGLFQARRAIAVKKSVLLTEGYMDVLTLHQFGYQNACAALGTALTPEQVKRLAGFCSDFELLFDGDGPGRKAAMRGCEMILARGLRCKVILLPDGEDIDSLLKKFGPEAFEELRKKAPDGLTFCTRTLAAEYAPKDSIEWVKTFLGNLEQPELFALYVSELSKGLGIEESLIRTEYAAGAKIAPASDSGAASGERGYGQKQTAGNSGYGNGGRGAGGSTKKAVASKNLDTDIQLLSFAVRYPKYAAQLRDAGIEFAFNTPRACAFWAKIIACEPFFSESDILPALDDKQRAFWFRCRAVDAPPDATKENLELEQICSSIKRIIKDKQNISRNRALGILEDGDDYENELLKALHEKLTGKPLAGKDGEHE